jgi:hypothetical protein
MHLPPQRRRCARAGSSRIRNTICKPPRSTFVGWPMTIGTASASISPAPRAPGKRRRTACVRSPRDELIVAASPISGRIDTQRDAQDHAAGTSASTAASSARTRFASVRKAVCALDQGLRLSFRRPRPARSHDRTIDDATIHDPTIYDPTIHDAAVHAHDRTIHAYDHTNAAIHADDRTIHDPTPTHTRTRAIRKPVNSLDLSARASAAHAPASCDRDDRPFEYTELECARASDDECHERQALPGAS